MKLQFSLLLVFACALTKAQILDVSMAVEAEQASTPRPTPTPTHPSSEKECETKVHSFDPYIHKPIYTIGVHAIAGLDQALKETNQTFSTYLTETAGQKFDPPIKFEVVPKLFEAIFTAIDNKEVDFIFANPGVYSCIGTEVGATALVTSSKLLSVRDRTFDLDVYGGVIAVRADNKEIQNIADIKDKIVGAGAIVDLMAGQMQIYELVKAGMSYVNDPKQVVFTKNQVEVVKGVLSGRFDVGFIRTNQIEITKDDQGNSIDPDLFRIIEPKIFVMDNGELFPFLHSTDIFPEWPLAALNSVPADVADEVQEALMKLHDYSVVGEKLKECKATIGSDAECESIDPQDFDGAPCDTNWQLAEIAESASEAGLFAGFRTARSYHELRTMQQVAGFMVKDEDGWYCTRPSNLYEGITCPEGYFKRSEVEFLNGCGQVGLSCDENENYDCFCKPCVEAFDVDVYQHKEGEEDLHLVEYYGDALPGCKKMSICATVQQKESVKLRIFDNMMRDNAKVDVVIHAGDEEKHLEVMNIDGEHAYEIEVTDQHTQVQVVEILFNGKPISQSPLRVYVLPHDCSAENGYGTNRIANAVGDCVCESNTYMMCGTCIDSVYFFLIVFGCVFVALAIVIFIYLGYKKKQSDSMWQVAVEELHFNEPPEIIGQGAFGVVVLGQYRGTKVAVKRAIPPQFKSKHGSRNFSGSGSFQGSGEFDGQKRTKSEEETGSNDGDKNVKFHGDVEAQDEDRAVGTMSFQGSMGGSTSNRDWERMLMDDKNYNSALKILESATQSTHSNSCSMLDQDYVSSKQRSRVLDVLPLWMRFDERSRLRKEFMIEMRLLARLRHPCITTVMGAVIAPRVDPMLVMEFMEYGSLHDLLKNETMSAGGDILLQIIRDVTQGILFLHASKPPILHGDLKAQNILVDCRFRAKVADFGFSHIKTAKTKNVLQGTPFFMAPEYLRRKSDYTTHCDIYSFGMILYEIYARESPFEGEDPRKVLPKVCSPRHNKRPPMPPSCPPKIADILKKCWSANPFFRPSAKDIDYVLVEMSSAEAEPLEKAKQDEFKSAIRKPTSLYDVFPKHIADALNAGKRVEPESHEIVTVVFSDIVGFTTISQTFTPQKVCDMLDRLYNALDECANKHKVFKVETIGDAYMGVTNLDGTQFETHVKDAAEFAVAIMEAASKILIDKDAPEKGCVKMRVGFHSGPVVSNVIGSLNPRYGLFGDTVNTASRMESNSVVGRVHCTSASAQLLMTQAPDLPVTLRGKIKVKGKGRMVTYWVGNSNVHSLDTIPDASESMHASNKDLSEEEEEDQDDIVAVKEGLDEEIKKAGSNFLADTGAVNNDGNDIESQGTHDTEHSSVQHSSSFGSSADAASTDIGIDEDRLELKINVICDVLLGLLKGVVAARPENATARSPMDEQIVMALEGFLLESHKTPLEEAADVIDIPAISASSMRDPNSIALSGVVQEQIHSFIETIFRRHRNNPFHDFVHAANVALAAQKFLSKLDHSAVTRGSFGLAEDKLSQFALVLATVIHDVDHRGMPNFCLAKADPTLHQKYSGKATQEQNSFELAWKILMRPEYSELRACIYHNQVEMIRFRQVLVKAVIATDIFDPEQSRLRMERWQTAFGGDDDKANTSPAKDSLKANAIIEVLIQASDVAHTMKSWYKYTKCNEKLFKEMKQAYQAGHFDKDPTENWFAGEVNFLNDYVVPLATRLQASGVLGAYGDACLDEAQDNLNHWEKSGKSLAYMLQAGEESSAKKSEGRKVAKARLEPDRNPSERSSTAGDNATTA